MVNKNSKGLGKGIDAIFSDFEDIDRKQENVIELELDSIRPNPYQPRKSFDEVALQELADSIRKSGVFQPIIVRQSVNGYEIIAGERRFRASKLAEKTTIPAIVREFDETMMMEVAILENLQREDLTPLEEAEAYDSLMKKLSLTQVQVSERLGKSRPYIANYLRLLTLPQEVKRYLQDGTLSSGQARTLLGLKDKDKITPLAKRAVKDNLTVRQLEQLVIAANDEQTKVSKKKMVRKSPYIRASEHVLMEKFGTQVNINEKGKGKGMIEIDYLSNDDLMRILDILDVQIDE